MKIRLALVCSVSAILLGNFLVSVKAASPSGPDLPLIGDAFLATKLDKAGNIAAEAGNIREAKADYQQALAACFTDETATLGLARCAVAEGNLTTATAFYRSAIYGHHEDYDIDLLTEYILTLNQDGQGQEAVSLYNHVADLCRKGRCIRKMNLVPQNFRTDGSDYDPNVLQSMTHLIRAMNSSTSDDKRAMAEIDFAMTYEPSSSLVYFYKGVLLDPTDKMDAKAAYKKAAELGDERTAAAKERLKVLR